VSWYQRKTLTHYLCGYYSISLINYIHLVQFVTSILFSYFGSEQSSFTVTLRLFLWSTSRSYIVNSTWFRQTTVCKLQNNYSCLTCKQDPILLLIILESIRVKIETEIADEQAGFRQGRGTKDHITNLRILLHKAREHQQLLYMCLVDFKKALDSISHHKLWVTVMDMGYPLHLIDLLAKLYNVIRYDIFTCA